MSGSYGEELLRAALAGTDPNASPVTHTEVIPAAQARYGQWPRWLDPAIVAAYAELGLHRPWQHQVVAAEHAFAGRHVVIATGTASGKSLAYQLPVLQTLLSDHGTTALYLAPTKALGADQLRSLSTILAANPDFARLAPCTYDGDTDAQLRQWARANSRIVFTNPDMCHIGILSGHHRWQQFLRQLRFIVVDECHHYRGVFGAHTALVLRRLLRVARAAGADPVVVAASATTADPARTLSRLIGEPANEVTDDASPTGERTVALWEPDFLPEVTGENGAPVRRSTAPIQAR